MTIIGDVFDLTKARETQFLQPELGSLLRKHSLQAHETVTAVAFFEKRDVMKNLLKFVRIHFLDNANNIIEQVASVPKTVVDNEGETITDDILALQFTGKRDLSRLPISFYHSD